jgi:hypothetical protein
MNAATHGITAKTLILCNEDRDHFRQIFNAYCEYLQPTNQIEVDLISEMVAARWRLRRVWRYETAILDLEMDSQSPGFEKRFETPDEDVRGAMAFATLVDKSSGLATTLRFDIHLSRTYRRALDQFRMMRKFPLGSKLQNEPTEPPKSPLNGANPGLIGAPPEES